MWLHKNNITDVDPLKIDFSVRGKQDEKVKVTQGQKRKQRNSNSSSSPKKTSPKKKSNSNSPSKKVPTMASESRTPAQKLVVKMNFMFPNRKRKWSPPVEERDSLDEVIDAVAAGTNGSPKAKKSRGVELTAVRPVGSPIKSSPAKRKVSQEVAPPAECNNNITETVAWELAEAPPVNSDHSYSSSKTSNLKLMFRRHKSDSSLRSPRSPSKDVSSPKQLIPCRRERAASESVPMEFSPRKNSPSKRMKRMSLENGSCLLGSTVEEDGASVVNEGKNRNI